MRRRTTYVHRPFEPFEFRLLSVCLRKTGVYSSPPPRRSRFSRSAFLAEEITREEEIGARDSRAVKFRPCFMRRTNMQVWKDWAILMNEDTGQHITRTFLAVSQSSILPAAPTNVLAWLLRSNGRPGYAFGIHPKFSCLPAAVNAHSLSRHHASVGRVRQIGQSRTGRPRDREREGGMPANLTPDELTR